MRLTEETISRIAHDYGTPVFIYDAPGIRRSANHLNSAFAWAPRFRNFFAVKALPRLAILQLLRDCGSGVECCSLPELLLAEKAGYRGPEIIYTCIYPLPAELSKARELEAIVSLDYTENLEIVLRDYVPDTLLFRLNPGDQIEGNRILGVPRDAKFGSTEQQIIDGIAQAIQQGVPHCGLHGMFASNALEVRHFEATAGALFSLAKRVETERGIMISHIDMGGGIGIPYRPGETTVDVVNISDRVHACAVRLLPEDMRRDLQISMECGRCVVGPHGVFITRVLQIKRTYKTFVFVDGSATNYPRPGVFGGYNTISVVGKPSEPGVQCNVVGLLCDSCDHFCVDRVIPEVDPGDLLVVHDAGAHAAAMSYDYNGRLRCREVMVDQDDSALLVHREQTVAEYLKE